MAGIVLTCMAGIVPTIPLHFLRLGNCSCVALTSDFLVDCLEVRHTNAADARKRRSGPQSLCISSIAPGRAGAAKHTTPWLGLFLQSVCISTIPGGQMEDNCRDAGARATQATGRDAGSYDSREGEGRPRREQRSRATQEQLPERLPSRHPVSMLSA